MCGITGVVIFTKTELECATLWAGFPQQDNMSYVQLP